MNINFQVVKPHKLKSIFARRQVLLTPKNILDKGKNIPIVQSGHVHKSNIMEWRTVGRGLNQNDIC